MTAGTIVTLENIVDAIIDLVAARLEAKRRAIRPAPNGRPFIGEPGANAPVALPFLARTKWRSTVASNPYTSGSERFADFQHIMDEPGRTGREYLSRYHIRASNFHLFYERGLIVEAEGIKRGS